MNKVLKGIGFALLFEVLGVGVFWLALSVAGTRWAALFGLAALPVLLVVFPEKKRRPKRGYCAYHKAMRERMAVEHLNVGDWPKKENA